MTDEQRKRLDILYWAAAAERLRANNIAVSSLDLASLLKIEAWVNEQIAAIEDVLNFRIDAPAASAATIDLSALTPAGRA